MLDLAGVFAPISTPFAGSGGDLDLVGLRRNARHFLGTDLAGLVLFGTTGEGPLLDEDERVTAIDSVRTLTSDALILAGAAAESTRATIRLVRSVGSAGADAVLVAPPAFYRPQLTPEALREHYLAVADASPVPVVLYQVPTAYSGVELVPGLVGRLAQHENIIGIKDSTGDLQGLGQLIEAGREGFSVLVGSGAALYGGLRAGACGGILGVANLAPAECAQIFRDAMEGRDEAAGELQERITPVHRRVVAAFGVPGVKAALDILGLTGGAPRPPLLPLGPADRESVRAALEDAGLLVHAAAPE